MLTKASADLALKLQAYRLSLKRGRPLYCPLNNAMTVYSMREEYKRGTKLPRLMVKAE